MTVTWMRARINCDGCGKDFDAEIDPARKITDFALKNDWSLFDYAVDAIRGGHVVGEFCGGSVQDNMMLCPKCTGIADGIDADTPTADQIKTAIEAQS